MCSEPSLQFSSVSLKRVCRHQKKAEGVGATLTPSSETQGSFTVDCRCLARRGPCCGDMQFCGMPTVPSVALHPKTNLLYIPPQEAWLYREAPWARECSLRLPHLLLVGQLTPKSGVGQPLSRVCWGSSGWNRLQKPPCSPPPPMLLTVHLFPRDRDYHLKTYKSVVPGSKLVDWLLAQVRL